MSDLQPILNVSVSEEELWSKVQQGDKDAFGEVYKAFFTDLYKYGMTIEPDEVIVGDAIQELFVDIWMYRKNLNDIQHLKYYLLKSLRSKIYRMIKKSKKAHHSEQQYAQFEIQFMASQEEVIIEKDRKKSDDRQVVNLINKLPQQQREAIMLIFFEGKTYEETSSIMSKSIQAIYTLVSRGVASLKKEFRKKH